jgi:hypothetical protein
MPDEKPRILACVPTYHAVDPAPFLHFMIVSQETGRAEARGQYAVRWMAGGPKVKLLRVRNGACKQALDIGASHLLLVDDDMLLNPADIIGRLLQADKDIVGPLFFRSDGNYDPLVFRLGSDDVFWPIFDYPQKQLFKVDAIGGGVMLIRRRVLETLHDLWFVPAPDGSASTDLPFCRKVTQAGFEVWCDSSMPVLQMGLPQPPGERNFQNFQNRQHP